MWVVRIGATTFSMHGNDTTLFVNFKHKKHAQVTERAIRGYVSRFHTLPPTYNGATGPLELQDPENWTNILDELHVAEIEQETLDTLCEMHSARNMEVHAIRGSPRVIESNKLLSIGFVGMLYPPKELTLQDYRNLYEYLL